MFVAVAKAAVEILGTQGYSYSVNCKYSYTSDINQSANTVVAKIKLDVPLSTANSKIQSSFNDGSFVTTWKGLMSSTTASAYTYKTGSSCVYPSTGCT